MTDPTRGDVPADFWERHYAKMTAPSGGRASAALVRFAEGRIPGRALELGCARGDDAIWLARQGWTVTGVDVAKAALEAARLAAETAGVADQCAFERHDLGKTFPDGTFDLVSALFLHSPVALARTQVLRRAAAAVAPGGLLLVVAHGSRAPWSWADPDTVYPTAQDDLAELDLETAVWNRMFVGPIERQANGPDGQLAAVIDTVIALEKGEAAVAVVAGKARFVPHCVRSSTAQRTTARMCPVAQDV